MARVLIIGCGCRGQVLASELVASGHLVRGTTRSVERLAAVEKTGAEARIADPSLLGQLMPLLSDVSLVVWLMASAVGNRKELEALYHQRLKSLLEKLIDTPVRGFIFEAQGKVDADLLRAADEICASAAATWSIPVSKIEPDPTDPEAWTEAAVSAVETLLQ